jgi:uncharacterized membrane protein YdjX (TVP38/TMEM64 family)
MNKATKEPAKTGNPALKILVLLAIVGIAAVGYAKFGSTLTLENLATKESSLRDYQSNNPVLVIGIAFAIYIAVTGLSLPGAAVLTLVIGWFFGFWQALIMVSCASTAGATLAFLISRFLLRDSIQSKFGDRLNGFNEALEREGAFYLFTLRLIPAVPFFVINLVMGLTPIRTGTYWWVSQIGMLPGTAVFVYAGSQFPSLQTLAEKGAQGILSPQLVIAFILLGLFPIAVKKIMANYKPANPVPEDSKKKMR